MANLVNQYISNKPINPSMQAKPAYTIDTTGKVKPLEDKAKLLPSKIFGSPIECIKDLKQDVLNIGKAAKGKANDHELGRINDLGLKLGAGALAAYLFVKNPLKLGKAMEIIGAGSFLASMALWPKLAIQAPIKARTGVDIHQKYIDSQGRKKMLHQDPQYDLTDLYSQEDLNKMGKKMGVAENLPDRNRFIKQRAKKTAVQGNTLWMMTAGLATPLASALMCNVLEKPVSDVIDKADMALTTKALNDGFLRNQIVNRTKKMDTNFVSKFCKEHADEKLSGSLIEQLVDRLSKGFPKEIRGALRKEIENLGSAKITTKSIDSILEACGVAKDAITGLDIDWKKQYASMMNGTNADFEIIEKFIETHKGDSSKLGEAIASAKEVTVGQITGKLKSLGEILGGARAKNGIISRFIKNKTDNVNQWGKTTKIFMDALGFSDKELKTIAGGDLSCVDDKIHTLANGKKFESFKNKFFKSVKKFTKATDEGFLETVKNAVTDLFSTTGADLKNKGFTEGLAEAFEGTGKGSAAYNLLTKSSLDVKSKLSSFYRLFQTVDAERTGVLKNSLEASGIKGDRVEELIRICKKLSTQATATEFEEKIKSCGFELSNNEFKAVIRALFEKTDEADEGFKKYCREFIDKVANLDTNILLENNRCKLGATVKAAPAERQSLIAQTTKNVIRDTAKNLTNSRKWLKMTGIGFAVVTAATLIATLAIGRKGKTEKQVEERNKVNG